ncbi:glycosyltransferase [Rubrivirga sp. S365]|uniref:Glycosyltransferase n=1 Tax=Rubrivirga litoralis TaxID=3075598 RepID=A0ABU3BPZ8_9BACT|nr:MULTISPECIES: glycosyltransferase [unclassified Rubrivirga]MDT0631363.1 glycosyltransferase [Rubrivirga sp. F394]MDT7855954.1 glycosyltransferase [Rubrivirga sp. S365]
MTLDALTLVVPTKDEAHNVGPFLASLDPRLRVVVVDASTDGTADLVRRLRPERTTVLEVPSSIPEARQIGLEAAETEWILFTDIDVSFGRGYWSAWEALDLGPRVGAVQGGKYSADAEYRTYYRLFSLGIRVLAWLTVPAGSGSNMVLRRRALLDAGGFDPALTANEDIYALWTVRRAGWRVVYAPALRVYERDHRRLRQGRLRKTLHGWIRPLLLFTGAGAGWVRASSWGYWKNRNGPGGPPAGERS